MDGRRLLILGMALAFALSGCGSSESTADKTFGDTSDRDEELIADVTAEIKQFSSSYTDLVVAFNAEDVNDARTAVDSMAEHLDKASEPSPTPRTRSCAPPTRTTWPRWTA